MTEQVRAQAVAVRAALDASGLDHGPISVHEKMRATGLASVLSTASLARILRQAGVARLELRNKPRSAWRRFVYPAPNACWQLDAAECVLTAHGVPQRLLTDNGLALNPSRRGLVGRLVAHVAALGTEAITGKPHKPTTQGKNERFHQTLFRYLDKQPLAATLGQLQAQIDTFDHIYNTGRPHQGLPGSTPPAAWEATAKADPPRPKPDRPVYTP